MTDNVTYTQGTGTNVATDDIGGVHYQRIKIALGADGSATDWVGDADGAYVQGSIAHDAVDSGNPVKIGGYARATGPASVVDGDRVNAWFGLNGAQVIVQSSGVASSGADGLQYNQTIDPSGSNTRPSPMAGFIFNGTTWDRMRSVAAVSTAPNVDTGITAAGIGPGFDRKRDPANLGTAASSTSVIAVDGADTIMVYIGNSTSGTFVFEATANDAVWVAMPAYDTQNGSWVSGGISPVTNKTYMVSVAGWRQFRLRTATTLGATMAHKFTAHVGQGLATVHGFPITALTPGLNSPPSDAQSSLVSMLYTPTSSSNAGVSAAGYVYNGTNWDRMRGDTSGLLAHGPTASDAALTVAPITVGARASDAVPTAVSADGDVVNLRALRTGALTVHMVDASGNPASIGGGTQYLEDADLGAVGSATGTLTVGRAGDTTPTAVSANGDAVGLWLTRSGATVVDGGVAHDAVDSGNPVKIGGQASTSPPATVAANDRVNAWFSPNGALNVRLVDNDGNAMDDGSQQLNVLVVGTPTVQGVTAHDAVFSGIPIAVGGYASLAAPSDVSADGDLSRIWVSRKGALVVDGGIAHDAVDAGNPVKIGGRVFDGSSPVASGDRVDARFSSRGSLFVTPVNDFGDAFELHDGGGDGDAQSRKGLATQSRAWAFNGTNWDRVRSVGAYKTAAAAPVEPLAALAPDRWVTSVSLGTAANSVQSWNSNGANNVVVHVGTTTTGTFTFEASADGTNWIQADFWDAAANRWATGNVTPAANTVYRVNATGHRNIRARTVTTLGATVALTATLAAATSVMSASVAAPPPHSIGFDVLSFANQYTSTQTSTNLVAGTAGKRIYVTHLTLATGGTVAGRVSIYWGTGAFSAGTSKTVFDGEFKPSSTAAPGAVLPYPVAVGGASATGDNLRITTSAGITVYVTIHYYVA